MERAEDEASTAVEVEICLCSHSTARPSEVRSRAALLVDRAHRRSGVYTPGPITHLFRKGAPSTSASSLSNPDTSDGSDLEFLSSHVRAARVCDIMSPHELDEELDAPKESNSRLRAKLSSVSYWRASLSVFVYQCCEDGPSAESSGVGEAAEGGGGGGGGGETEVVNQVSRRPLNCIIEHSTNTNRFLTRQSCYVNSTHNGPSQRQSSRASGSR
jgi:hypothetical protein